MRYTFTVCDTPPPHLRGQHDHEKKRGRLDRCDLNRKAGGVIWTTARSRFKDRRDDESHLPSPLLQVSLLLARRKKRIGRREERVCTFSRRREKSKRWGRRRAVSTSWRVRTLVDALSFSSLHHPFHIKERQKREKRYQLCVCCHQSSFQPKLQLWR